ncbi:hypothetical protein C8J35_11628 [Rhizobium sp. PP-F2F-G38]|nr:hypothetical protein C8J35_11628 [Rhizobium sp. PP-F2F-G38]
MAESQDLFRYDVKFGAVLEANLSLPRLAPYLKAAKGDISYATKIYLWNARLAKAFLFPLQIVEVATRNSINRALGTHFKKPDWVQAPPFLLTPQSTSSYQASLTRLKRKNPSPSSDDIVASLTFDFWSNLFRVEYDALWSAPGLLRNAFPLMPTNFSRGDIQNRVAKINWLRNRIAHHETIHAKINVLNYLSYIDDTIGYICPDTMSWVQSNTTVKAVLNSPPNHGSDFFGIPLALSSFRQPPRFVGHETLFEALTELRRVRPPAGLVTDIAAVHSYRLLTSEMILSFVEVTAKKNDGYIAFDDHTVSDVIKTSPIIEFAPISIDCTTGDAKNLFFPKGKKASRPQALIVIDNSTTPHEVGIIAKPSIKF